MFRYGVAAALGVVTALVLLGPWTSPWLLAIVALALLGLMTRVPPRLFAAFLVAAVGTFLVFAVGWSRGWERCASELGGVIVEHDCAESPRSVAD